MNFLAHIYLSGDSGDIQVGNFIGDFVKGKSYLQYPREISKGILLHRSIDEYFDNLDFIRGLRKCLVSYYGKYSGVAVDLIYDYYLAKSFKEFHHLDLKSFAQHFYNYLSKYIGLFDQRIDLISTKIIEYDWLSSYKSPEGMQMIAMQLERRIGREIGFENLSELIHSNNNYFQSIFDSTIKEIQSYSQLRLQSFNIV